MKIKIYAPGPEELDKSFAAETSVNTETGPRWFAQPGRTAEEAKERLVAAVKAEGLAAD